MAKARERPTSSKPCIRAQALTTSCSQSKLLFKIEAFSINYSVFVPLMRNLPLERANGSMAAMDIDICARIIHGSAKRPDLATVEDVPETTAFVRWDDGAVLTRMPLDLVERLALTITALNA